MTKNFVDSNVEQEYLNQLFEQGGVFSEKDAEKFAPLEDPRIYGFVVNEINDANGFCAVKIGDTYRTVNARLAEWRKYYANLTKVLDIPAYVDIERTSSVDSTEEGLEDYIQRYYFRDYVIHRALRTYGYRHLVYPKSTSPEIVYQGNVIVPETGINAKKLSEEFMIHPDKIENDFETIVSETTQKINEIVEDIKRSIINNENKYEVSTTPYHKDTSRTPDFTSMPEWDYEKYPYQAKASDDLVEKFILQYENRSDETEPVKVLLDAPTRSGKTAMISWSLKEILYRLWSIHNNNKQQKTLIVFTTGIPDVFDEFQEFVQRHKDVKNFITWLDRESLVADFKDGNSTQNPIDKAWQTHNVVAVSASLQYLAGRQDDGTVKDFHKIIENKISIVVADECHYGLFGSGESYKSSFKVENDEGKLVSDTTKQEKEEILDVEASKKQLFSLNPEYGYIFASATTYNILDNDAFVHDNVVFVRQSDVDAERKKSFDSLEKQGRPVEESAFFGRVDRHFFGIDVEVPLNELFSVEEIKEEGANAKKIVFGNRAAYSVLDSLFGIGEYKNVPALMNNKVLKQAGAGRNILFQMASKKACDALEEYFVQRKRDLNFNVINTSSSNTNKPWTKAKIQKIKRELYNHRFGKNVMITVNRGTTGVSIPQLDTEVLLNTSSSLVRRVQTYGRVNTPWVEEVETLNDDGSVSKKKICYKPNTFVIDFDASALYSIENDQEILNRNTGNSNGSDRTLMGTIWTFDGLTLSEMKQLDIHKQLDEYTKKETIPKLVTKVPLPKAELSDFNLLDGFDLKGGKRKTYVSMNAKGEDLAKRQAEAHTNSIDDNGSNDDNTDNTEPNGTNLKPERPKDPEETRQKEQLEKQKLVLSYIWERTYLYALLNENVDSLQDVVEDLRNKKDRSLINDLGLMLFMSYYEEVVSGKNFGTLDSLERGIKAIQARSKDDDGNFSIDGFLECVRGLSRISSNEVFTPQIVADMLLDKEGFDKLDNLEDFSNSSKTLIDNADKSGIIVSSLVKRLKKNNLFVNLNAFYSVPTSPIAYQITYRVFEELGLNTDNILFVRGIDALLMNEILDAVINEKDFDFDKIDNEDARILVKDFWEKTVDDIKKFNFAISNPPYQMKIGRSHWIYTQFITLGNSIAEKSTYITPSSFLNTFDTTQGIDVELRHSPSLREIQLYCVNDVFQDVSVNGIAVSVFDSFYNNTGKYIETNENGDISEKKPILTPLDRLPAELLSVVSKISGKEGVGNRITGRNPWDKEFLQTKNFTMYKVAFKEKNVSATHASKILSPGESPEIAEKHKYLAVYFATKIEANNFLKYQKSNFYQTLVSSNTTSHAGGAKIHDIAPDLEDYTDNNPDIDWNLPLDPQLYKLFNLTEEEIKVVEGN